MVIELKGNEVPAEAVAALRRGRDTLDRLSAKAASTSFIVTYQDGSGHILDEGFPTQAAAEQFAAAHRDQHARIWNPTEGRVLVL